MLNDSKIGAALYHLQKIAIVDEVVPQETIEQAYIHEVVHWILFLMGSEKAEDEQFVDVFAHLLYQAMKTMEYEAWPT